MIFKSIYNTFNNIPQENRNWKVNKYSNLNIRIKEIWKLQCVKLVPVIMSVEDITPGIISKHEDTGLHDGLAIAMLRAAILQTPHTV